MFCSTKVMVGIAMAAAMACAAMAEIPETAKQDPRFKLGYLVVTAYPGVSNDGSVDSTAGIQQAIEDARQNEMTVLIPAGEYLVSDTLRCFNWQVWNADKAVTAEKTKQATAGYNTGHHVIFGEEKDGKRPLIRLSEKAKGFDDPEKTKPIIAFRMIRATEATSTEPVDLAHPLDTPKGFENAPAIVFGEKLANVDFDCGGNAGAVAIHMPVAQDSTILNVRINAEGAYAGFDGLPGRNSVTGNVEVVGGRIGIINSGSIAGSVIVGARLINQTENAITHTDFSPLVMTGFHIESKGHPALTVLERGPTANGAMSLIDGTIEVADGSVAFDNSVGKTVYLRNVYVKGVENILQSGAQEPVAAKDGWNCIDEYVYCDQKPLDDDPPYEVKDTVFRVYNVIDGKQSQDPQPIMKVSQKEPSADLIAQHLWKELPIYTGQNDGTIVATEQPYGATPDNESDDAEAIQKAIDAAAEAGHGRVFLPKGEYLIGKTIELKANTIFMGAGWHKTHILAHPDWIPAKGEQPAMIQTVDDANATTVMSMMMISAPADKFEFDQEAFIKGLTADQLPPRHHITMIDWRAGKNSMSIGIVRNRRGAATHQRLFATSAQKFSGHGGGKHYSIHIRPPSAFPIYRPVLIDGTSEPLAIYGLNSESPYTPGRNESFGMSNDEWLDRYALQANTEIKNAANVRIYGVKREGASPSFIVRDSQNVAIYSSGAMRNPIHPGLGGYIQFLGNNKDVMAAVALVQAVKSFGPDGTDGPRAERQQPLLRVERPGEETIEIEWPESIAIFKQGDIDDGPFRLSAIAQTQPTD